MWRFYALISALFATFLLAKARRKRVDLALAIRIAFMPIPEWGKVSFKKELTSYGNLTKTNPPFLGATNLTWIFCCKTSLFSNVFQASPINKS